MPRKRSARMAEMNSRMEEAIVAVRNNQFKHITDAATHFEVNYETLLRRLKGRQTYAQSRESQQLLSKAEEDALYLWYRHLTAGGRLISHQLTREIVMEILLRDASPKSTP